MGNHAVGRAVGLLAMEAERARGPDEPALTVLDRICTPYRNNDAEFEAEDPDRPGRVDAVCDDYRYPHPTHPVAALGRLMVEAFAPAGKTVTDYAPFFDDGEEAVDAYWDEVIGPFRVRYDFW